MAFRANQAFKRMGRNNPFLRYGLPMISLTVLGALGLSHLQQGRKEVSDAREELEWAAIGTSKLLSREGPLPGFDERQKTRKKIDLEQELEAFREKVDIDSYQNKPVPNLRQES